MSQPMPAGPRRSPRHREIAAIFVMAFAFLIAISLHSSASGAVGIVLARWLRRAFGMGADAPALLLLFLGVGMLWPRMSIGRARKFFSAILAYLTALSGFHLVITELRGPLSPYWVAMLAQEGDGGGIVGGWIGARLLTAFGPWGSGVVLTALLFVSISLYMETPISRVASGLGRFVLRLLFGGANGLMDFGRGVVDEIREAWARLKDFRARSAAEKEAEARARQARAQARASARARKEPPTDREARSTGSLFRKKSRKTRRDAASLPIWDSVAVKDAPSDVAMDDDPPVQDPQESVELDAAVAAAADPPPATAARPKQTSEPSTEISGGYALPTTALLRRPRESARGKRLQDAPDQSALLEETLASFGVQAKVVKVARGPVITRYELQPSPGIKVSRIVNLADDLALSLAAADVRIEAPVPGKSVVGIEVPNKESSPVYLRDVLESDAFQQAESKLVAALGKDIAGNPVVADLTKLLHVLIAGATGSGKSVCINTIICSLLYKARPDEVKLMMIDPKRVELAVYDGIPHLIAPVVTDPKMAANALRWGVKEMESRYKRFSEAGVRNIAGYNDGVDRGEIDGERMPYLVVIIDELADLMLVAGHDVEDSICRLAQMARAAGIHLVIATQRPSVDVITGLIKANVPSRIAFAVSSGVDSRTILDAIGAERLVGKGDMLYHPIGANKPLRAQGALIFDKDVQEIVAFWKRQGDPTYAESVTEAPTAIGGDEESDDELFDDAVQLVVETGNASISMLQRRFRIGYARAARLIDMMELQGIVGPYQGSKPREVLKREIGEVG